MHVLGTDGSHCVCVCTSVDSPELCIERITLALYLTIRVWLIGILSAHSLYVYFLFLFISTLEEEFLRYTKSITEIQRVK